MRRDDGPGTGARGRLAAPPLQGVRRWQGRQLRSQLHEASVALRSMEAVTDPALTLLGLDDLLDAVLTRTKDFVGGDVVAVLLLDERSDGADVLRVRAAQGRITLAPIGTELPVGERGGIVGTAARWARPVVEPDVAHQGGHPTLESERGFASLMAAPLVVEGRMLGMVEVGSTVRRTFDSGDLRLLEVVADRCAASIERARLDDIARRNRLRAEHANLQLRVLVQSGTALGKALGSYQEMFDELADVLVPDLADWFSVDAIDQAGGLRRLATRGRSRSVLADKTFAGRDHPHPHGERLIRLAMAERRPQVYMRTGRPSEAELDATMHTPTSLGSRGSDVTSMMIVPVRVQGSLWGALSFVMGPGRRGYRRSDLLTARELAERVGVAVERVMSWRSIQQAGEEAVDHARRLQRLVEAALVVNAQLAEEEVLDLLAQYAQRVLDAELVVGVKRLATGWGVEKNGTDPWRQTRAAVPPEPARTDDPSATGCEEDLVPMVLAAADIVADAGSVVRSPADPQEAVRGRGWLGAPITAPDGGCNRIVIAVGPPASRFTAEDESVLTLLAQMASVALQNAGLYAEVQTNERRLEAVVESTPLAIAELDPDGGARWWNRAAAQTFGWPPGAKMPRVPVRPGFELVLAGLLDAARAGKPVLGVAMPAIRPGGGHMDLSVSVSPLGGAPPDRQRSGATRIDRAGGKGSADVEDRASDPTASGAGGRRPPAPVRLERPQSVRGAVTGLLLVAEDVTERKRLREEFQQAERLNAMTRMAGAVAHDFNNLLTVMLGSSDLIARRLADDELRKDVEAIQRAGTRAAALTSQLVRIGAHRPVQPEVVDVDEVAHTLSPMLAGVLGDRVTLEVVTRASGWPGDGHRARAGWILVDRSELERSMLNLAINAVDAMPDGGTVSLYTETVAPREPGGVRTVRIVFADTGVGMDADTATQCFEPFFTTKGRAKGTGLGLSTVHATVTQAGGEVAVDTAPGKGTRFTFTFPAYEGEHPAEPATARDPGLAAGDLDGAETLLVVDDEPEVLRLEVRELQLRGYEVLTASNASEALRLLHARDGAVDLLLTDVVMPGMNGFDLAAAVRRRWSRMSILFVSGHLDDEAAANVPLEQDAALLTKPFRSDELARSVRESLDRALDAPPARRPTSTAH